MLRKRNNQKFLSTVLAVAYLFVALFSQNFHQHESGVLFKDFNFKKSDKTFSQGVHAEAYSDCLSCHLLHDGNATVLENADFPLNNLALIQKGIFEIQVAGYSQTYFYFNRRGPPVSFS
ncbi:hypothetical protein [Chryseobacterium sp. MP_3.2]|uniref:hypothetical protein n=1 Tax=Chryseobacterium sp. MP_3.2 TaxID=3071712 RepID=UPI002E064899|nr:hypothetical protein [Chryseobacterium sp. MP_3.2]